MGGKQVLLFPFQNKVEQDRSNFQLPHNAPTRLAEVGQKSCSHDSEGTGLYEASFVSGLRLPLNHLTRKLLSSSATGNHE